MHGNTKLKYSEYVTLIAFPWHQTSRENASMLRHKYAYVTCLLCVETKNDCWNRNQDHSVCYCAWKRQVACHILTNRYIPARNTISYCVDLGSFHFSQANNNDCHLLRFLTILRMQVSRLSLCDLNFVMLTHTSLHNYIIFTNI